MKENKETEAKFFAIKVKDLTNTYPDNFKFADEVEYANAADKLYEENNRQAFIGISRFADTFIDMFVICRPEVSSHEHLQELYSDACYAFGLDFKESEFNNKEIDGENFFRRLRYAEWLDYIYDWQSILDDFGIPHFKYGQVVMTWVAGEEPY